MYAVQVLNPDTGNIAMNLGLLPGEIVKRLESINEEVYCQYCGRKNDPNDNVCSNCGANL
jgi:rRNA maturation endonuclease Nob1